MLPSLNEQIEEQLLLVRGARERGDRDREVAHMSHLDYLLSRVPRTMYGQKAGERVHRI